MEANQVADFIGKEVYWEARKLMCDIVGYEKGWVTIKSDDDEEHKVRAKDLVLMDSEDELVESEEGLATQPAAEVDPLSDSSATGSAASTEETGPIEIRCSCGEVFTPSRTESFTCVKCGKWHRVRLHPDLDKYVKGMGETASGRDTVDIDDTVATMLRGLHVDDLYKTICGKLEELDEKARFSKAMANALKKSGVGCADFLYDKYQNLNPGMQRMNLGNLLRGAMKRQEMIDLVKTRDSKKPAAAVVKQEDTKTPTEIINETVGAPEIESGVEMKEQDGE